MLVAHSHLPAIGGNHAIVQLPALDHGGAKNQRRAAIGGQGNQIINHFARARQKRTLEHKVFRWIAGQKQLTGNNNICPRSCGLSARLLEKLGITRQIAHGRVKLGQCNLKRLGFRRHICYVARAAAGNKHCGI